LGVLVSLDTIKSSCFSSLIKVFMMSGRNEIVEKFDIYLSFSNVFISKSKRHLN